MAVTMIGNSLIQYNNTKMCKNPIKVVYILITPAHRMRKHLPRGSQSTFPLERKIDWLPSFAARQALPIAFCMRGEGDDKKKCNRLKPFQKNNTAINLTCTCNITRESILYYISETPNLHLIMNVESYRNKSYWC